MKNFFDKMADIAWNIVLVPACLIIYFRQLAIRWGWADPYPDE